MTRCRAPLAALAGAAGVCVLLATPAAQAFVRTRSKSGLPTAWRDAKLVLHVPALAAGRPIGTLTSAEVLSATTEAAARWTHAEVACSSVEASVVQDAALDVLVGADHQNTVIFRDDSWSPKTFDKDGNPIGDYEPNQLALTLVSFQKATGAILDADIEINAFSYRAWEVTGDHSQLLADGAIDLQNTLTHEIGHALGFEHSCWDPTTGPQPLDQGVPVPECGAHPELVEAAMAPTAPPGDVGKRALHDDDRSAVCAVYPFGKPVALQPVDEGGCAVAGTRPAPGAFAPALLALLGALRRRR